MDSLLALRMKFELKFSLRICAWAGRAGEGLSNLKKDAPRAASDVIKDALSKVGN